jgi:HAD superfamily hydrolase (TIGR01490 family)
MARWAVFDVDGTLLPGISMEREFLRYLTRKRLLPSRNILLYIARGFLGVVAHGWEEGIKVDKAYLRGLRVTDVMSYAEACFRDRIAPAIGQEGRQEVEALRQAGFKIMIISGAPRFLVDLLDNTLQQDFTVATELETKDECYTGTISGLHPFGTRKRAILESLQEQLDIDFSASKVFANHHSDVDHMALFGKAVAVNPDPALLRTASELGWQIATWS